MPKKGTLSVTRLHQNRIEWWCVHGCLLRKDFYHITVATIPLFWLPTMNVMGRIRSRDLPTHLHMNTDSATRVKWVEWWIRKISEFKTPVLTSFWCCRLGQPIEPCCWLIISFISQTVSRSYWIVSHDNIWWMCIIRTPYFGGTIYTLVIRYYNPLGLVISTCGNIFNL